VGLGMVAQAKPQLQVGDAVSREAVPVAYPRREPVGFYRVSKLKVLMRVSCADAPPSLARRASRPGDTPLPGPPPPGSTHLHFQVRSCLWGCRMPVTMIIDQWEPSQKRYRYETFCYGPKSCSWCLDAGV